MTDLQDGDCYLVKVKALFGKGYYEDVWKFDGIHKCFFHNGGVFKADNKRIKILKKCKKCLTDKL